MIEALILVHLWSLVVAAGAAFLQRDRDDRVGTRFPPPHIWLVLIGLSILPGALYLIPLSRAIPLPDIEAFEVFAVTVSESPTRSFKFSDVLWIYFVFVALFMGRTLWRWSRLQRLHLMPTHEADVFTTQAPIPPLTLSWPSRAVVVPDGTEIEATLIHHERAHLRYYDAEITLWLLLLRDMMLLNPGFGYLVEQWRLSIELRADRAVTEKLSRSERKDYATLLLNTQRPAAGGNGTLPCPTAWLTSRHHRAAKMRLVEILETGTCVQKTRWRAALPLIFIGASGLGLSGAAATGKSDVVHLGSGPIAYVKQTPLQMPAKCPGLINDLKSRGIKIEKKDISVDGQLVSQHRLKLGTVILKHDVRKDGSVYNSRVIDSTHSCFEPHARTALNQWMAAPQEFAIHDAVAKLQFVISAQSSEDMTRQLEGFFE